MAEVQARLRRLAEHVALAHGCTATIEYLQDVPAVCNTTEWVDATLPTLQRVLGPERILPIPPTLGYDDVSVFVNAYGGLYVCYGVQDTRISANGLALEPEPGGRGLAPNHHPAFYADDESLVGSVRVHAHVAIDHLGGVLDVAHPVGT
jgi:amidohydrolase